MMGLGYKQSHKKLRHPKYLYALRRADEDLGDIIILGGILAFGFGTFFWLFLEANPPEAMYNYPNRHAYLSFLYPLLNLFFFSVLFVWLLDSARTWPRVVIIATAALHGCFFLFAGVLSSEGSWEVVANGIALCYSLAIIWTAAAQIVSIHSRLRT